MENNHQSFWQFSDQLRVHNSNLANLSLNNSIWSNNYTSKSERRNFDIKVGAEINSLGINTNNFKEIMTGTETGDPYSTTSSDFNDGWKKHMNSMTNNINGSLFTMPHNIYGMNDGASINGGFNKGVYSKPSYGNLNMNINVKGQKGKCENEFFHQHKSFKKNNNSNKKNVENNNDSNNNKKYKTLPLAESLPRNETIGGYIFVCNNDTMTENLKRELFGLPPRYRDYVRAITPGLPLFLYNYSTHQLHGIFEIASFGGSNIDPSAWEDKKCPGESRFPAQVKVITRKKFELLEEDSFRPVLHHYDGPKFRLELNVTEALSLLDIFADQDMNDTFKAIPA
ncbi:hypothetical protein Lal_00013893 [Lupinus albus]|uniref:Putative development/cell death domain-containing protein n=1 Tax=Lupinus albus TaxID=3870 RepID=A0A6A5MN79_LUPAL|nr:putative development/cell death domain-containing protein [Lupinus albus]KAF1873928.1 hypothetical protein Lal_00013893 [Lupinus albus]